MAEPGAASPSPPVPRDAGAPRRVLVAYATRHGSTREVAEEIATTLRERGLRVDLRPAAGCERLDEYAAVVIDRKTRHAPRIRKADDGPRTRDLRLGKPTLYQLSYVRAEQAF
jgi:Flavodoxin domain